MSYFTSKNILIAGLLSLLAFSGQTHGADKSTALIKVRTENFYPISYIDKKRSDNKVVGFATELVEAILKQAALDYEIKLVPWARVMQQVNNEKNVIAYSMTRTPKREPKYYWIGEIASSNHILYGLKQNYNQLPKKLESARHLTVGGVRGDVIQKRLTALGFTNLVEVNNLQKNLALLHRGRIDLMAFVDTALGPNLEINGGDPNDLKAVINLHDKSTVWIVLSKQSAPTLAKTLQDAYKQVVKIGKFQKIMEPMNKMLEKFQ